MKDKNNYIFGDAFGNLMMRTSQRFQFESMLAGLFMVMIGLVVTCVYIIGWTNFGLFFKIMTGLNTFFGILILYSSLVTTFQQYKSYLEVEDVQKQLNETSEEVNSQLKANKIQRIEEATC